MKKNIFFTENIKDYYASKLSYLKNVQKTQFNTLLLEVYNFFFFPSQFQFPSRQTIFKSFKHSNRLVWTLSPPFHPLSSCSFVNCLINVYHPPKRHVNILSPEVLKPRGEGGWKGSVWKVYTQNYFNDLRPLCLFARQMPILRNIRTVLRVGKKKENLGWRTEKHTLDATVFWFRLCVS